MLCVPVYIRYPLVVYGLRMAVTEGELLECEAGSDTGNVALSAKEITILTSRITPTGCNYLCYCYNYAVM